MSVKHLQDLKKWMLEQTELSRNKVVVKIDEMINEESTAAKEKNLEKRKNAFYIECCLFSAVHGEELIESFFEYWSEINKSKTKMRYELERTWETSKRLATWARNSNKFGSTNTQKTTDPNVLGRMNTDTVMKNLEFNPIELPSNG